MNAAAPANRASAPMSCTAQAPLPRWRTTAYLGLNAFFWAALVAVTVTSGSDDARIAFLGSLLAVCSTPLLFVRRANGPYTILVFFLSYYFFAYGAADLYALIFGTSTAGSAGGSTAFTAPEVAIVLGAVALLLGYGVGVVVAGRHHPTEGIRDWSPGSIVVIGIVAWILGLGATWIWQMDLRGEQVIVDSDFQTMALVLGRMLQPFGVTLLAYRWFVRRERWLAALLVAIVMVEFPFGFVADSKELSLRAPVIILLTKFLIDGQVPTRWLLTFGLVVLGSFAVFQAYRLEILQTRATDRTEAARDIAENLDTALSSTMLADGYFASGLRKIVERVSLKPTMEMVVTRTGADAEYREGETLAPLAGVFIPKILWPTKPDASIGQQFNRAFQVSADPDTYISATHSGELYWNFGWPGLLAGMLLIGTLLGYVGARFDLSRHATVTRLMVLTATIYLLCLRFEGGIALQYTLWMRSLVLIAVLHWLFARLSASSPVNMLPKATIDRKRTAWFPNVMR